MLYGYGERTDINNFIALTGCTLSKHVAVNVSGSATDEYSSINNGPSIEASRFDDMQY